MRHLWLLMVIPACANITFGSWTVYRIAQELQRPEPYGLWFLLLITVYFFANAAACGLAAVRGV